MHRVRVSALVCSIAALVCGSALAQPVTPVRDPAGLRRLQSASGGTARVGVSPATAGARFVRVPAGRALGQGAAPTLSGKQDQSRRFFRAYAALLGVSPEGMRFMKSHTDRLGETHLTWGQYHGAVPVFGAIVKTHFDRAHQLKGYSGTAIPDVTVNPTPTIALQRAAGVALAAVTAEHLTAAAPPRIGRTALYVFRSGLAKGVPGENHLVWEVEISNGAEVRELVYVDAHTGKIVDRISGIQDELSRRAYDGHNLPARPRTTRTARSGWKGSASRRPPSKRTT